MPAELIVALDVPDRYALEATLARMPPEVSFYKVGLELFAAEGPAAIQILHARHKRVFLDLKLHDIPRTVGAAVRAAAAHGVNLITVHATGGRAMLEAAAQAAAEAGEHRPLLVAVTTLTSLDQKDLTEIGIARDLRTHTLALGRLAIESGIDGLVCSPLEIALFRDSLGPKPILVTPGIRPAGAEVGDQKRVASPAMAVQAGANLLVVGRPIVEADDPTAAARAILKDMR